MIVTINTDAAYHTKLKVAGYAFWIVCDSGRFSHAGTLKGSIQGSTHAEMRCMANALHVLFNLKFRNINKIVINTDSLDAIHVLENDKEAIRRYRLKSLFYCRDRFNSILKKNGMSMKNIELRHVKAHSGVKDKRSWVNEWCDSKSKEAMWQIINSNILRT